MGEERSIHVKEKHRLVTTHTHPTWDGACNLGVCPDWELIPHILVYWDSTPTKPHWSGQNSPCFQFTDKDQALEAPDPLPSSTPKKLNPRPVPRSSLSAQHHLVWHRVCCVVSRTCKS